MNQQPDKFFRDKLENYQRPAPTGAWDKIEAGLEKKTHKGLWWKIAASLLVAVLASYSLWVGMSKSNNNQSTATTTETEKNKPTEKTPALPEVVQPKPADRAPAQAYIETQKARKPATSINPVILKKKTQPDQAKDKIVAPAEVTPRANANAYTQDVASTTSVESTKLESTQTQTSAPVVAEAGTPAVASPKKIVITITAAESEKYLDKNALAEATSPEKKPSTFQKLLKKADDLKNNQDPFGELRQRKNEILALNFKSEKRGQNK